MYIFGRAGRGSEITLIDILPSFRFIPIGVPYMTYLNELDVK
jgi:hypothetical protein